MPRHPDIAVGAVDAVDLHPVDKSVGRAGQRAVEKRLPARDRPGGAQFQPANGAFKPRPFGAFQLLGAVVENGPKARRQLVERGGQPGECGTQRRDGLQQRFRGRMEMRLQIIGALDILDTAIEGLAKHHEKLLGRTHRRGVADPFLPSLAGQRARRLKRALKVGERFGIIGKQLIKPAFQPTGAPAPSILGAADPVTKLGCLLRAEIERKGTVGGIEQMMSLIEDIAHRASPLAASLVIRVRRRRVGGIDHHQRMIADHDIGAAGPAHRFLDKTSVVMAAGAVDTFAAPVGKADCLGPSGKVGQPGRKGRTCQIAIIRRPGPAGHQPQRGAAPRRPGKLAKRLLQIEKAQVILPPLADHHLA